MDNNILYLFLFKLVVIFSDIGIVFFIVKIAKKPNIASIVFTVAWLMKWQNIIFTPIFYLYIYRKYSLNAFNGWWLVSGLDGMKISDKTLVLGVIDAKQFILSSALVTLSFFHLLTQSHERYLFNLLGFVMLFYFFKIEKKLIHTIGLLSAVTLGILFNMYISMALNYPDQVYWPFSTDLTRLLTLFISIYQIAIFAYIFIRYFSIFIKKHLLIMTAILILFFVVLIIKNYNYLLRKPISLTKIAPVESQQDYLRPMINMTVESARGVKYWNRLSNNYYFYNQGIGTHANSLISYNLEGRFSNFSTDFGIDTEGGDQNKAVFIIQGDGRELYRSKPKGKYDLPESIVVSIKNINKLTLVIKAEGNSNNGLHADWLNPVLIR